MAKQTRQTSRRLRAAEDRGKANQRAQTPRRVDRDRGLAPVLIGLVLAALGWLVLNLDTARDAPQALMIEPLSVGTAMLSLAAAALLAVYLYHHAPRVAMSRTRLLVFGVLLLVPLAVARLTALGGASPHLVPVGATVFIASLCYGRQVSLVVAFVLSLFVAVALRDADYASAHPAALPLMAGAIVWTFGASRIRRRLWLFKVGFLAAFVQFWLAAAVGMIMDGTLGRDALWAATNGVITGSILTAVLPIIEYLFSVNTEISLLELADLNQPLMRQLSLQAPGTYHHSLIVGSLSETAAEAIGANPLLARVGAYFHDIGKLQKPDYFSENEGTQGSRHDQLTPSMSALIISAHVKDGAEMADEHNLPQAVIDIIEQHHGTSLMGFFYHRSHQDADGADVSEELYRYPGPRPRTREAAIIHLADAAEAASRTLPEPSPARLKSLVHDLTLKRLLDGQLDECPITLTDLAKAEASFVRVLAAIFHSRVKYPASVGVGDTETSSVRETSAAQ
jgi:hypothetical protein